jgi:MFS family permease
MTASHPVTNMPAGSIRRRPARNWTMALLAIVAMLAAAGQSGLTTLLVPIQQQLQVSDAAMGFLMGSAFAAAQSLFSLPLAWISDRSNRRNLLALSMVVWAVGTAASGLAGTFFALVVIRLVVGAAEAAQIPTSVSLVSDLFSKNRRGTAFMFTAIGSVIGFALGAAAAGAINDRYNWNVAMFILGAPGLIVAAILFLTVREPIRGGVSDLAPSLATPTTLRQQLAACLRIKTLPPFMIASIFLQAAYVGWIVWFPAFLIRVHGLSNADMGAVFGAVILCSVLSAMWGGPVSDWVARRAPRHRIHFLVVVALVSMVPLIMSSFMPTLLGTQICIAAFALLSGCMTPVSMASYSALSPPAIRAFVSALITMSGALLGAGIAPAAFGYVNDGLTAIYGNEALRYTLLLAPALYVFVALFFWIASRSADADTAAAEVDDRSDDTPHR